MHAQKKIEVRHSVRFLERVVSVYHERVKPIINVNSPIGVFDSGLGGLSVAADIRKILPHENIVFFGDSARNPYGTKTRDQVEDYSLEIVQMLKEKGVKAVVIACNTATSCAAKKLRSTFDFDIIGMEPALKVAADCKTPSTIAVWATDLTLREEKFAHLEERFDQDHRIIKVACPRLVELVEQDRLDDLDAVDEALNDYLAKSKDAEFIVLGCTHFLYYKKRLAQLADPCIRIVDGNEGTVRRVKSLLEKRNLLAKEGTGTIEIDNSLEDKIDLSKKLMSKLEEEDV